MTSSLSDPAPSGADLSGADPDEAANAVSGRLDTPARLAWAVVAAWSLLSVEFFVFGATSWSHIAGLWELSWGGIWLLPGAALLSGVVGLVAERVICGLAARRWSPRALALAFVVAFAIALGWGLTHGRHFEVWWRRVGFIGLLTAAAVAGALWLGPKLRTPHRTGALTVAGLLIALELANRFLLVRLYPAFHWGLAILTVAGAVALARLIRLPQTPRWAPGVVGGLGLVMLGLVPTAAERLSRFDNFRWLLLERAPLLGQVVRVQSLVGPAGGLAAEENAGQSAGAAVSRGAAANRGAAASQFAAVNRGGNLAGGLDFSGRDILLVTIDALRADHVGAYGYDRETTPNIDRLSSTGARFEHAYSATPHTSYSVTSLMTGKYIRPLLLQGAGKDSETWASLLRRYGYRTAAFFPPAVFFIDTHLFQTFDQAGLGFEYQKREFLEGAPRVAQVRDYLAQQPAEQRVFAWVHLFGPHEPYVADSRFDFGDRDVDRYDSEVAAADHTLGEIVSVFRKQRPNAVVIVSADHGEEFGDHGGRYHGTSVYEEQVRVPLIIDAPGAFPPAVVQGPVQTVDLLPTVLSALQIPVVPRIRGRDLGGVIREPRSDPTGFAYAETESQTMLAQGDLRLLCARKVGACRLFDLSDDPGQHRDVALSKPQRFEEMRAALRKLNASHGRFEASALREEHGRWPPAILLGIAGDGDAAPEIAALLDDADVALRRKAAELLFRLARPDTSAALQLALERDEDETVRNFSALTLTRLGLGAALTHELLDSPNQRFRRLAALALAESGDRRGHLELVAWWQRRDASMDFETSKQVLAALGEVRSKEAVWPLVKSLGDVRLRTNIAQALSAIGDETARGPLARALSNERYHGARTALAQAVVELGGSNELVMPLRRWLGVPDPLAGGLAIADRAGLLEYVGGPAKKDLARARKNAHFGELVRVIVPPGGNGKGLRLLARAINQTEQPAQLRVGLPHRVFSYDAEGHLKKSRKVPEIHPKKRVSLKFPGAKPGAEEAAERWVDLPASFELQAGRSSHLVVLAETALRFESLAVLPLQDELAPGSGEDAGPAAKPDQ